MFLQMLLPIGLAGLTAFAQQLFPLLIYPSFDTGEGFLISWLEQMSEAALAFQPRYQRQLVMRPVGQTVLTIFIFEERPVAGVRRFAG